jgi:hypothetical protein
MARERARRLRPRALLVCGRQLKAPPSQPEGVTLLCRRANPRRRACRICRRWLQRLYSCYCALAERRRMTATAKRNGYCGHAPAACLLLLLRCAASGPGPVALCACATAACSLCCRRALPLSTPARQVAAVAPNRSAVRRRPPCQPSICLFVRQPGRPLRRACSEQWPCGWADMLLPPPLPVLAWAGFRVSGGVDAPGPARLEGKCAAPAHAATVESSVRPHFMPAMPHHALIMNGVPLWHTTGLSLKGRSLLSDTHLARHAAASRSNLAHQPGSGSRLIRNRMR